MTSTDDQWLLSSSGSGAEWENTWQTEDWSTTDWDSSEMWTEATFSTIYEENDEEESSVQSLQSLQTQDDEDDDESKGGVHILV